LGFEVIRLKTGTPPRVLSSSIDFSKTQLESGSEEIYSFSSYRPITKYKRQVPCYLTRTNINTHNIINSNLTKSAMYGGIVEGIGPRYCPSIEDKVVRFSTRDSHQIFLEPESLWLDTTYIQGFSTSMPKDVQELMVKSVVGLENSIIKKYAYAIEYDAVNPLELYHTLETKRIKNLFLAGQINGTSGYEEAACQGLVAGINIIAKHYNLDEFVLSRSDSYIGVLIDDLVTKGTKEPYRMLTARAEYRLILRHDNALERLSELAYKYKLISRAKYNIYLNEMSNINYLVDYSNNTTINPNNDLNNWLISNNSSPILNPVKIADIIKRPEINELMLKEYFFNDYDINIILKAMIKIKYEDYIIKANNLAQEMKEYDNYTIPIDIDYNKVNNLSNEAKEKLNKVRPTSIGQASRIIGINPVDINVLMYYLKESHE